MSLPVLRHLVQRAMRLKIIPPIHHNRQRYLSGYVKTSETHPDSEETVSNSHRDTFGRHRFALQRSVNIKNIFSDSEDPPSSVDGTPNQEDNDQVRHVGRSAAMSEFQQNLSRYKDKNFEYSLEDWKSFQKQACTENPGLHKSWESLSMQLLYQHGCTALSSSLLNYIDTATTSSPNISTLSLYIALQGEYGGEDKETVVRNTIERVLKISDVFDAITAKYLICGLSQTALWEKCVDILEMAKLSMNPGRPYYSPIIAASLREGNLDLAFNLLDELAVKGFEPQSMVLKQILLECGKVSSHDLLDRFFACVWKYNWLLSPDMASEVELYFTKSTQEKWSCKWTTVNTVRGTCHGCKHELKRIELDSSDFEVLQREFLERSLVGSNVYLKSNPAELEKFKDFVMENAPFDVVLDALNIASKGAGRLGMRRSTQLREIVHYFARERHMRVLVIGRAHMRTWSAPDMNYIRRHAKLFFTDNTSSDDPFLLYATLYSGRDCLFVSGDFMRDHKYTLGPGLKDVFERWQKSRQIVNFVAHVDGVSVNMPSQYDCGPVQDDKGWHIPYEDGNSDLRKSSQSVLCLRYKGQRDSSLKKR